MACVLDTIVNCVQTLLENVQIDVYVHIFTSDSASHVFNIRIYVCHLVSSVHTCRIHVYWVCVCVYRLVEVYVEKCRDKDRANNTPRLI